MPATDPAALRLLAESAGDLATYDDLASVPEEWAKVVADRGYDVRGDLGAGAPGARAETSAQLHTVAEALNETVAEVVRLRSGRRARAAQRQARAQRLSLKRKLARVG